MPQDHGVALHSTLNIFPDGLHLIVVILRQCNPIIIEDIVLVKVVDRDNMESLCQQIEPRKLAK